MKTFINPVTSVPAAEDAEGQAWIGCIRTAQVFLIFLSFTVIHHITNPFDLKDDVLTAVTAAVSASECAFLVIISAFICMTKKESKEPISPIKKYSTTSMIHPSEYSIHPVYFI